MSAEPQDKPIDDGAARSDPEIVEALRLRPARPSVMRVSPRALALLSGVGALAIGGSLIWALHLSHPKAKAPELYRTEHNPHAEGLANLPGDYAGGGSSQIAPAPSDVPQLGPPLPGDLGRPILKAGANAPTMGQASSADPAAQQANAAAAQHADQEQLAARTSRLFASDAVKAAEAATPQAIAGAPSPTTAAAMTGMTLPAATSPQAGPVSPSVNEADRKLAFLAAPLDHRTVSPERIESAASPYVLQAGAVIAAALITGMRSDVPGQVTAQVSENVYDSPTGRYLLIPQGSRLVGQYDAQVSFGQSRALLVWTRLILPDGRSIVLERQPGADTAGYAGLEDRVDNHWGQLFKAAVLSTVISVGAEAGTSSNENDLVQAIRQGASDSISQTGRQVVGRSLSIQPTLTVRPGFPVRVIVTRDMVFPQENTMSYPDGQTMPTGDGAGGPRP